jgi:RNA polymerase sigma-70 factor (ECF subfamily)
MSHPAHEEIEQAIQRLVGASDVAGATTAALQGYGPEIFRFLLALHRDEGAASEVFSYFAEGVWRGLASFDWARPFRSWAFGVARRSSLRYRRDEGRRAAREVPLELHPAISAIEEQVRTRTLSFLRSERRSRFAEIRDALPPDDRALLMLRVDQKLAWSDIARAMQGGEEPLGGEALKREAARLRKRFQIVRDRLVAIGRSEGLVGEPSGG